MEPPVSPAAPTKRTLVFDMMAGDDQQIGRVKMAVSIVDGDVEEVKEVKGRKIGKETRSRRYKPASVPPNDASPLSFPSGVDDGGSSGCWFPSFEGTFFFHTVGS